MRRTGLAALLVSAAAAWIALLPLPGRSQETNDLAGRVASAPDGTVRFHYEAREGVCGDGHHVNVRADDDVDHDRRCEPGPVWVELLKSGAGIEDLDMWVGRTRSSRAAPRTDLGEASPAEAADYLLSVARRSEGDVGEDAVGAASLAADVVIWPELLEIARDESLETDTRESAVFWLAQLAGERATAGLEEIVASDGDTEVKEAALFALSQLPDGAGFEALVKVARESDNPELIQVSLFWLGQTHDPRALALFEEILTRD